MRLHRACSSTSCDGLPSPSQWTDLIRFQSLMESFAAACLPWKIDSKKLHLQLMNSNAMPLLYTCNYSEPSLLLLQPWRPRPCLTLTLENH